MLRTLCSLSGWALKCAPFLLLCHWFSRCRPWATVTWHDHDLGVVTGIKREEMRQDRRDFVKLLFNGEIGNEKRQSELYKSVIASVCVFRMGVVPHITSVFLRWVPAGEVRETLLSSVPRPLPWSRFCFLGNQHTADTLPVSLSCSVQSERRHSFTYTNRT